ncbi:hypothetical protein CYLTODRAFT_103433 [Cylindrobasidium torrendii FP15055 ss-10]|uniref:Uncharacterized protein n=1 Tax=Cylindrobasidium torrendii FP15055 ss-10 TaxID=1314674 RepID=A0A0D7BNF0_9AGAR|nr:hypothetical protein CYLTODRAFT_103433 [Cylindrobasidium torrendii FP15055 ss-10]
MALNDGGALLALAEIAAQHSPSFPPAPASEYVDVPMKLLGGGIGTQHIHDVCLCTTGCWARSGASQPTVMLTCPVLHSSYHYCILRPLDVHPHHPDTVSLRLTRVTSTIRYRPPVQTNMSTHLSVLKTTTIRPATNTETKRRRRKRKRRTSKMMLA